ncbi:MAG TPA: hypothetical protein VD713_06760 [Sphingomonadales bacterium]|nr:hypothetical protein [Sphingomonadales bacterium]
MLKTPLTILAGAALVLAGFANANTASAGGRHHYPRHHGHHHGGHYLGYAALGAGLGFLIYKAGQSSSSRAYERGYADGQRDVYYRPSVPQVIVVPPAQGAAPGADAAEPYAEGAFDFSQCRETRPYETTIYVEGEPKPAYGTACLTHDGRWVAGPMSFGR